MNRKHNPRVALAALLLSIILFILCAGCGVSAEATEPGQPTETAAATEPTETTATGGRFKVEWDSWSIHIGNLYVITDRHTGAQYLVVKDTNALAMTELQNVESLGHG